MSIATYIRPVYNEDKVCIVNTADFALITEKALESPLQRFRICVHPDNGSPIHEMFICLNKNTYVQPHKHINKTESYLLLKGELDIIFFDEEGNETSRASLTEHSAGGNFFLRAESSLWHTVLVKSDYVIMFETTNGPLDPTKTVFADWAPPPRDEDGVKSFMNKLSGNV